jgi:hypothetical protein
LYLVAFGIVSPLNKALLFPLPDEILNVDFPTYLPSSAYPTARTASPSFQVKVLLLILTLSDFVSIDCAILMLMKFDLPFLLQGFH